MTKTQEIKIETAAGVVAILDTGEKMLKTAKDWNFKLASRHKWVHNPKMRQEMQAAATKTIKDLGMTNAQRKKIALAGIVEVSIPFKTGSESEEALILPWEYLLSAATKEYRGDYSICVVRYLDNQDEIGYPKRSARKFGFVETAPGIFSGTYQFNAEREMVSATLGNLEDVKVPVNPSTKQLKETWKEDCPEVLHVTGIDSRLGLELARKSFTHNGETEDLGDEASKIAKKIYAKVKAKVNAATRDARTRIADGLFFADNKNNTEELVNSDDVALAFNNGDEKPLLIGLNCSYSGSGIAPRCVAHGARTAIGIQNEIDDSLSERFFVRFYQAWLASDQDILAAFIEAWEIVKPMGEVTKGTGIILWSGQSVFDKRRSAKSIEPNLSGIISVKAKLTQDKQDHLKSAVIADPALDDIKDLVGVKAQPNDVVNYCMLQNGQSVLSELYFWFKKIVPRSESNGEQGNESKDKVRHVDCVRDIEVEVMLKTGSDSLPFRTRISLGTDHPQLDLADKRLVATDENPAGGITIPLTSALMRSVDENMNTSLYVNVEWEGQVLLRHTFPVTLAPVDEWRLNEKDSLLIPAFVQPRDPIIVPIIESAQKYLHCINQDPIKGFDGYQSDNVHCYLEAIWSALIYDYRLEYVSPPPSSNTGTQRLRTPSQVIEGKRGTCVELAILLASCFEWVELYPVIFMTEIHAFVGCWASHEAHEEFVSLAKKNATNSDDDLRPVIQSRYPWVSVPHNYKELKEQIDLKNLVPLEAVALTWYYKYEASHKYAMQYFAGEDNISPAYDKDDYEVDPGKFESMIDIYSAREHVTPIPIWRNKS